MYGKPRYVTDIEAKYSSAGERTFKEEYEAPLCETRLLGSEGDDGTVGPDRHDLLPHRSTISKVSTVHRIGYVEVVMTLPASFDVEFEIEQRHFDRLLLLNCDNPVAFGVHVELARIVGTGDVSVG